MRRTLTTCAVILLATSACEGEIGDADGITPLGDSQQSLCTGTPSVAASPMRRLSNTEYRFTVADLLGMPELAARVTATFAEDTESLGYRNGAEFLTISSDTARQYSDAADVLSVEAVTSRFSELVRCNTGEAERDCARRFITSFGERAYRRPLTPAEINDVLTKSYDAARTGGYDFRSGIEWVIFGVLQSPQFLHRVEIVPSDGNLVRIGGYEMASRLSYLIWGSMPDAALLAAARNGQLDTDEGVAAQSDRLLADPKARRMFDFFVEWLDLDRFNVAERDAATYGALSPALPELLRRETETFINHIMWEEDGSFDTLLTAPYTYMNQALAQHYGVSGVSGEAFVRVELDPSKRLGLLMQTSMLTAHDKLARTSIVRRGLKIRTDVLCGTVGSPPDDAVLDLPPTIPGQSQRQMLEEHRTNVTCNACHTMMDPLGQVFESIDGVGRVRTHDDAGNQVDTSGVISLTDVDGPVSGPTEMVERLAESNEVRACFATQLFRYAYGRKESKADGCSQERLLNDFIASGYNLRGAISALTRTDAFLYRVAK